MEVIPMAVVLGPQLSELALADEIDGKELCTAAIVEMTEIITQDWSVLRRLKERNNGIVPEAIFTLASDFRGYVLVMAWKDNMVQALILTHEDDQRLQIRPSNN